MENQTLAKFSFKSSWKSVNMAKHSKCHLNIKKCLLTQIYYFSVSLQLERKARSAWKHLFKFKLIQFSAALAKSTTEIHSPDKPRLVESLKIFSNPPNVAANNKTQYIIDGGNLIYKMRDWKKQTTF